MFAAPRGPAGSQNLQNAPETTQKPQTDGTATDDNGDYEIRGVSYGKYNIIVSYIGYDT